MARMARVPVCVWQDAAGEHTASLVQDFENGAAVAPTAEEALRQLRDFAQWAAESQPWRIETEIEEARLVEVKVVVRPEFRSGERRFFGERSITMQVPCVWARDRYRGLIGSLPTLGVHFEFADASALRELVAHYAQSAVQGFGPRELALCLGARNPELQWISVRVAGSEGSRNSTAEQRWPALTAVAEPVLGGRGVQARVGSAWERGDVAERLAARLMAGRGSLLVSGEPGVGKTTVIAEMFRRISRNPGEDAGEEEPESVQNRYWLTSASRLIAGMQYLGQWEARCEEVIEELAETGGILWMENLLEMVRLGGTGAGDSIGAFLMPFLARGEVRLIVEARPAELEACRRWLPGFVELFEIFPLAPMTPAQSLVALRRMTQAAAAARRLDLAPGVVELTARLFQRFRPGEPPPGPAAGFLRRLVGRLSRVPGTRLDAAHVWKEFTFQTGLPEALLRDDHPLSHESVRDRIQEHIVGQEAACDRVAGVVTTFKAGLNDPGRPIAAMLFCGPTGVGKTAMAHTLARVLFGQGSDAAERLVRLDMSEYGGDTAADRFMQRPDGEPASWLTRIHRQPFCVLLLDEIEKAAPEVFDLLLGLLDEGRLTDRFGRVTSFQSAVVILTSNLGVSPQGTLGFGEDTGPAYEAEAMGFFRPEFFNRLDVVLTFHPLNREAVQRIARLELEALGQREGLRRAGLQLRWDQAVEAHLAGLGYDRRYGARPLQRAIEREVARPLSEFLLGYPAMRNRVLRMTLREGSVVFEIEGGAS